MKMIIYDNIFVNNPENNIVSGNVVSDTTDHVSQMCILTSHCKPFLLSMQSLSLTTHRILIGIIFANIPMPINRSPGFTNASTRQLTNTPL